MADWNQGEAGSYAGSASGDGERNDGFESEACRACGQLGHFARECPDKPPMLCRVCNLEGHFAKECPDKVCQNCGQAGHIRQHCENARLINRDHLATMTPEEAWLKIKQAVAERDMDDVREAVQEYMKAMGGIPTYRDLQEGFIGDNVGLWLISLERELLPVFANMDLQGNMGKKYSVSYRFSEKPERPIEVDGWPSSRDEILTRLDDAGEPTNTGKSRCQRCGDVGHIAKECSQEQEERQGPVIACYNCKGEGHRVRDCPQPRIDRDACRNCGKSGHRSNDCEEPPNPANVECRKCSQLGHFAKDCPTAHLVTCRNCEAQGHMSRDCPLPTDWSKVICSACKKPGHTKVRCTNPLTDNDGYSNNNVGDSHVGGMTLDPKAARGSDDGWPQEASYVATPVDTDSW